MTDSTRADLEADERVILAAGLTRNSVLRRALKIAARERIELAGIPGKDAESCLMLTWIMQASEETEERDGKAKKGSV